MLKKFLIIIPASIVMTGCPKIDQELPPISEYADSEGWYEDAFIRIYKADLPTSAHPQADTFTHPWMVLKPVNSDHLIALELTESNQDYNDCTEFDPWDETNSHRQYCGHINLSPDDYFGHIDSMDIAYYEWNNETTHSLGELRGGGAVSEVVNYILDQSKNYPCRHEYNPLTHNSNTYVRVMLENAGFYSLYEETNEVPFKMGRSSWGQQFWKDCSIENAE